MLLILIPIAWISVVALVLVACRMAAKADAEPTLATGPEGRSVREGLVVWDSPTPSPRRRRGGHRPSGDRARLTAHGLR